MSKLQKFFIILAALVLAYEAQGEIVRSQKQRAIFQYSHPCPATGAKSGKCGGFVVDHIIPLACGGLDAPLNMQWQSIVDAKDKDKWERKECDK